MRIALIIILFLVIALIIITLAGILSGPEMNEAGEITECIGCPYMRFYPETGLAYDDECVYCEYNPEYWDLIPEEHRSVKKPKNEVEAIRDQLLRDLEEATRKARDR